MILVEMALQKRELRDGLIPVDEFDGGADCFELEDFPF